jgi:hypothetical protein
MKTTMNRQFAVGDFTYLIEIMGDDDEYILTVSLEGNTLLNKSSIPPLVSVQSTQKITMPQLRQGHYFPDDAMTFGKRFCYLDTGQRMGILGDEGCVFVQN